METKKNIMLVPIDFSDISMNALSHAAQLAKHFNNDLVLLNVLEEDFLGSVFSFSKNDYKDELAKEALTKRLDDVAEKTHTKYGIKCKSAVRSGKVHKAIVEAVSEFGCDSIVMGTHGASGVERILGSAATKVISYAETPVIIVKTDKNPNAYKNIVFPLDLSSESKQKVKWAVHLAKSYKSVIHILTYEVSDPFLNNKIMANLNQVKTLLEKNRIEYTDKVLEDDSNFARVTLNYAEAIGADLIMIMTQQEDKSFREYLIETYAQQIVNDAGNVPIFCINPTYEGFRTEFIK